MKPKNKIIKDWWDFVAGILILIFGIYGLIQHQDYIYLLPIFVSALPLFNAFSSKRISQYLKIGLKEK